MRYPGGKNATYHRRINEIPPLDEFVELFLGSGAVMREMRPARIRWGLDLDRAALAAFVDEVPTATIVDAAGRTATSGEGIRLVHGDAIQWLRTHRCTGRALVYADPPWLPSTRLKKRIYRHEMTEDDHVQLLEVLREVPAMVMLEGYPSKLYERALKGWRVTRRPELTRGGMREVWLWMNYDEPDELHDPRYLGDTYREREKLGKQRRRLTGRLLSLPDKQRHAILGAAQSRSPRRKRRSSTRPTQLAVRAPGLVLSLFPGIGLLDQAFSETGFCVVQGPDLINGTNICDFHGEAGFVGLIGGPPCQDFSKARRGRAPTGNGVAMLREFLRVLAECRDASASRGWPLPWALVENVPGVPDLELDGYSTQRLDLNHGECGGSTNRWRHIQFLHSAGWILRPARIKVTDQAAARLLPAVLAQSVKNGDCPLVEACRRMDLAGVPSLPGRSQNAIGQAVGNGVPLKMGRVLAAAVLRAGPVTQCDCVCGCGRRTKTSQQHAGEACRQRTSRQARATRRLVALTESK